MELKDIKTIDDMKKQAEIYGVMAEQIADNLQDMKKLSVLKSISTDYVELLNQLNDAQYSLYRASQLLCEVEGN